jgi:hypothetical protein
MLNDEPDAAISAGAILVNLGLGGGGGNTTNKPQELARSRKVLSRLLFDSARIDGKK